VVEPLADGVGLLGPLAELFPDMSETDWAPYRDRYPELVSGNDWRLPIMCFLVRAGDLTIVVDTGAGPKGLWTDWMPEPESQEKLLPELRRHGVEPEDVDIVFLTHVHIDHVGWNAQEDGSRTFPRARYLLHEDASSGSRALKPSATATRSRAESRSSRFRDTTTGTSASWSAKTP
jgi:glyoxylase-like metal-dependent hydrolase (beta-lactamase superfamily II)